MLVSQLSVNNKYYLVENFEIICITIDSIIKKNHYEKIRNTYNFSRHDEDNKEENLWMVGYKKNKKQEYIIEEIFLNLFDNESDAKEYLKEKLLKHIDLSTKNIEQYYERIEKIMGK